MLRPCEQTRPRLQIAAPIPLGILVLLALALVAAGCGDDDSEDETTNAALDELAGSVEMMKGTADAMTDLIWRQTADGQIQRWGTSGWQDMDPIVIIDERQPLGEGHFWVHVVEDSPEVVTWVLVSDQPTKLNPTLVANGTLPPDPPEDLRFVSAVLALEHAMSPPGRFRIDCETSAGDPAVALVLTEADDRPIARAWQFQGPFEYVHPSLVTCP